jgi:CheY-like chemotaxis protein
MNILIIEDEKLIQKSLKLLLERAGDQVTVASLGREALEFMRHNCYDRVICDLMLDDISGFDVIDEAKKIFKAPNELQNKIILISAYKSEEIQRKVLATGCLFIQKPFHHIEHTISTMRRIP